MVQLVPKRGILLNKMSVNNIKELTKLIVEKSSSIK
jgi:hypothetical protein